MRWRPFTVHGIGVRYVGSWFWWVVSACDATEVTTRMVSVSILHFRNKWTSLLFVCCWCGLRRKKHGTLLWLRSALLFVALQGPKNLPSVAHFFDCAPPLMTIQRRTGTVLWGSRLELNPTRGVKSGSLYVSFLSWLRGCRACVQL